MRQPEDTLGDEQKRALPTVITGTASAIRVIIDSRDRKSAESFSTVGVGTNIIEASWRALVDAVEYKLALDDARWAKQTQGAHSALEGSGLLQAAKAPLQIDGPVGEPAGGSQPSAW